MSFRIYSRPVDSQPRRAEPALARGVSNLPALIGWLLYASPVSCFFTGSTLWLCNASQAFQSPGVGYSGGIALSLLHIYALRPSPGIGTDSTVPRIPIALLLGAAAVLSGVLFALTLPAILIVLLPYTVLAVLYAFNRHSLEREYAAALETEEHAASETSETVLEIRAVAALVSEGPEDFGDTYLLELGDGQVLCLQGQYLDDVPEEFPFEVFRLVFSSRDLLFKTLEPAGPPLTKAGHATDHLANSIQHAFRDGDMFNGTLETINIQGLNPPLYNIWGQSPLRPV